LDAESFGEKMNVMIPFSSFVPVEVFTDDSDARRLSIAFQNVSILPQLK